MLTLTGFAIRDPSLLEASIPSPGTRERGWRTFSKPDCVGAGPLAALGDALDDRPELAHDLAVRERLRLLAHLADRLGQTDASLLRQLVDRVARRAELGVLLVDLAPLLLAQLGDTLWPLDPAS